MTLPSYQMLAVIFSVLSSYAIFADAKDHTIGIKIGLDKRAGPGLQEGIPFVNLVGKGKRQSLYQPPDIYYRNTS